MWLSYFYEIQKKYSMRLSYKNPLVIRLDGKNVTKNKNMNMITNQVGSFRYDLENCAKYFSKLYHCYSIFGSDEISFIVENPVELMASLDKDKDNASNEVISLFSQMFFDYFNENKTINSKVFWHAKCFSIKSEKIKSYVKFRSTIIKNVMTTNFLKRCNIRSGNKNLDSRAAMCKKQDGYNLLEDVIDGVLYFDGNRIKLDEFYNDNVEKVIDKKDDINIEVLDLTDF